MTTMITPNSPDSVQATATDTPAVPSLDSIASKMAAMREQTERNLLRATEQTATGTAEESAEPVAPDIEVPEVADTEDAEYASDDLNYDAPEEVSTEESNSSAEELIDFIEFAETNPNAKFKFLKNGKEVVIDAKKAAAILGQGGAIHEEARQLKVERAEFDEYLQAQRAQQEGLTLAMEFTVEPRLQGAYDEIVKTQNYQTVFQQQLAATQDPGQQARIQASMRQNEQYIRQQQAVIGQLKPAVDQFRQVRKNQVSERLDAARKSFQDKELKNEYVYNELRDKVAKVWPEARSEIIPGIANIDLISSDENLLALVRDGLKYRSKPTTKSAGSSMAVLTQRRGGSTGGRNPDDGINKLREQAKAGDKKAGDNLLVQRLQQIRGGRR
ncbi:hypothetical protein UFOVP841_34 [uncultured Caudovirales phage]|uniref:Uncharacterized protein n=1 Tax=uncultured Caudovirales phage TaxID=2100421 RepID=A0A6J5PFB0_9CAUD|nr:hypothetical protein UFOVP841_34 [uncultured Caudovirales phage]